MSATTTWDGHAPLRSAAPWLLLVGMMTAAALVLGGGDPAVAVAPVVLAAVCYAACVVPLRTSATTLLFLLLTLDRSSDAEGKWNTRFAILGDLLNSNLDSVIPAAHGVKLSGLEIALFGLLGISMYRRARRINLDVLGQVPTAGAARDAVLLLLAAILVATVNGLATGGSVEAAIWQARPLVLSAALFFFFQGAYRGREDHAVIARTVVVSAVVKSLMALWVAWKVMPFTKDLEHATNHGDSVLFTVAGFILIAHFIETESRRSSRWILLALPVIVGGMLANNRRLAWVAVGITLPLFYVVSPWRRWKRALTRGVMLAAPLLTLYVGAGWSSSSAMFKPVRMVRSVVDTKTDRSSWDRHVENWNLGMSMRAHPLLGLGLGHEWTEVYKGDEITSIFPQYKFEPHNQVLGWLLWFGAIPFTGVWALFAIVVFLLIRSYRCSQDGNDRAAALAMIGAMVAVFVQCYGDLGLYWTQSRLALGLATALAAKLAVSTGAWPTPARRLARQNEMPADAAYT